MAALYRSLSEDEKAIVKELKATEEKRVGKIIPLSEILQALTPGEGTPHYLKKG